MKKLLAIAVLLLAALYGAWTLSRSRTVQLFGEIVPRVETSEKVVALTFDDGPRADVLQEVLAPLTAANVKATFYLCGAEMQDHPGVAERLLAAGHALGNHSWSHQRMVMKSPSFIRREVEDTDAVIRKAGYTGPITFRAPYCKKLVGLPWYLRQTKRTHVTFDVEPESDPEIDGHTDRIVRHVVDRARPGSIILLHPWYRGREATRAAVPAIIAGLKAKGFAFVTIDELLRLRNA